VRVIVGEAYGARSPVQVLSPMFYVDVALAPASRLPVPDDHAERAAYVVQGSLRIGEEVHEPGRLLVFAPGATVTLEAESGPVRLVLIGGAPLDGPRFVWWNFVSSSRERIDRARDDWAAQRFAAVPGETEFIPLPATKPSTPPL
jgi:redox-sensitive bicupin YhaK (pirin superfamily)